MPENHELEVLPPENAAASIEAVSRAEIDVQIRTARAYPRKQLSLIKQNMMSAATLDEETAASCFYKLPRGGGMIEGPSVRLAEIAAANYGNLRVATRTLSTQTSGDNPHVVVQVAIHDLENNLAVQVEKRRRITGKKSKGGKPDEDDINLATNACASIAFRDAVFRVVPNVLIHPVMEACKKVAVGMAKSLSANRAAIMRRLNQMGVSEARVLASLKLKKVEDITLEHCEELIGRGTALKEGGTVEDIFPVEETAPQAPQTAPQGSAPQPTPQNAPNVVPMPATGQGETVVTPFPNTATSAASGSASPQPSSPAGSSSAQGAAPDTTQGQLAKIVTEAGYTFADFARWGNESGNVPGADSLTQFDDLPNDVAKRLIRAKMGLLQGLNRITGH